MSDPWICPRCKAVNAPWMPQCTCKPKSSVGNIGVVGGHARALALSPERRKEIARNAAKARWSGI